MSEVNSQDQTGGQRQVALHDHTSQALAFLVTAMFALVLAALIFWGYSSDLRSSLADDVEGKAATAKSSFTEATGNAGASTDAAKSADISKRGSATSPGFHDVGKGTKDTIGGESGSSPNTPPATASKSSEAPVGKGAVLRENNIKDILFTLLGVLGTGWATIIGFYFGSSASSQQKSQAINAALMKKP